MHWHWLDDDGKDHAIDIPNTLYCPTLPFVCLLSPQHLAKESNDHHPSPDGTWLATYSDHMVLFWSQRKAKRTIPLSSTTAGVGFLWSAPGFKRSCQFLAMAALSLPISPVCFPASLLHNEAFLALPYGSFDDDDADQLRCLD